MSDLINKTLEELIEFCKEKGINYLTKAKKPMAKKTIINNLKKAGLIDDDDEDDDLDTETTDINVIIRKTHNYLYKNSGVVGAKAQNDIMRVLIMRIFNILLSKNNSYLLSVLEDANISDKCLIDDDEIIKYKSYIYDISNLLKEPDIKNVWLNFIGGFMSKLFDNIYVPEDANFNTPNDYDITRLIKIISKFIITDEFIDEFFMKNGDIHESFLKYQGNVNSKELGQFFTPKPIIKSLLNECGFKDLILNKEGSNLSLCDLCMGTGGLLCYTYNYCKEKINPSKIYGCEIEKDTIKFGNASLMISTNQYNSNILRCNSLIENPYLFNKEEDKFDIIFINPPFGTKTNYKSLNKLFNNYKNKITTHRDFNGNSEIEFKDIYPIVSNTGTELFIQLVIYSLKKDGIACIILPDGELMTSVGSYNIRKYILDYCQILKIINIQGGAFTNTGVKTKALIIKKCNNDNYNQDIEFIELNQEVKVLGIRKLNEKLQFTFEDKKEEIINYNKEIEIKTLGEICEIQNGKRIVKDQVETGEYPVLGGGGFTSFYTNEYSRDGKSCKISREGMSLHNCVMILNQKYYLNSQAFTIISNNDKLINNYLWYYLDSIKEIIYNCGRGTAQKAIDIDKFKLIKIPIPSIEIQNKIIEYLDMIYETVIKNNNEKIENIKKLNKNYLELNLQFNKEIEIKTLGEIASINQGKLLIKNDMIDGLYDVIGGGKIIGTHNINNRDGDDVIITRVGDININYISNAYYLTDNAFSLKTLNNNIMITKYLYYIILNNKQYLKDLYIGTAQKVISKTNLSNVKIPIPSIEKQKEIIEYLEFNDNLIKTLEKENEINKNNAELLMKQILYK
jgi:type I restriction enzyme S subunit